NVGNVILTQFNNKGFSNVGTQLRQVSLGGALTIDVHDETNPPSAPAGSGSGSGGSVGLFGAPANSGDLVRAQFDDGGFGKVGLQLRRVRVHRSVGVAMESWLVQDPDTPPEGRAPRDDPDDRSHGRPPRTENATNIGTIVRSQFNDGGFGDIGAQWS